MDETEGVLSLKWNDFRSDFSEGFHNFLQEEAMVDVTLAIEGKFIQAHKLVLSVCSPYFKNLFQVNPCKHPIVILRDVAHSELSCVLEFMYTGEVNIKQEELPSFLKLADTLQIRGLAEEQAQRKQCRSLITSSPKSIRKTKSSINKENSEIQCAVHESEKGFFKSRKRRLSRKVDVGKKFKSESQSVLRCDVSSENVSENNDQSCGKSVVISGSEKSSEVAKKIILECGNKSVTNCNSNDVSISDNGSAQISDNKSSVSAWPDNFNEDNGDSGGLDLSTYFPSDDTEETEQTPQDFFQCATTRSSPIWKYYEKREKNLTVCRLCRKLLKGAQTTQAEYHLRAKHPTEAIKFDKEKAVWKKKKNMIFFIPGIGRV